MHINKKLNKNKPKIKTTPTTQCFQKRKAGARGAAVDLTAPLLELSCLCGGGACVAAS